MSFVGAGTEDWPELDLLGVEHRHRERLRHLVAEHRAVLTALAGGPFELRELPGERVGLFMTDTASDHGTVARATEGADTPWATVSAGIDGRLVLTRQHRSELL